MRWRIKQDGIVVAGGTALQDMFPYALQYLEEGDICVETQAKGGRWKEAIYVKGKRDETSKAQP